jgi:hypothetical protein
MSVFRICRLPSVNEHDPGKQSRSKCPGNSKYLRLVSQKLHEGSAGETTHESIGIARKVGMEPQAAEPRMDDENEHVRRANCLAKAKAYSAWFFAKAYGSRMPDVT